MANFKFRMRTKIKHKIKMNKRILDFNKEILIGEVGALIGASFLGFIGSLISRAPNFVSISTLIGSIFGGSTSMLITKVHDEKKYKTFSKKKLVRDISLYTPAAFLIAGLVAYPVLLFVTNLLFVKDNVAPLSSFIGELAGFGAFLIVINIYRYSLSRLLKRELA